MSAAPTIFALATAPGKSGVAVIRLSGPDSASALRALTGLSIIKPRHAHYATFRSRAGTVIDQGLALYFPAPHSFTGEDVAEFHAHGSLPVLRELLAVLAGLPGLRPAEPGEFSRRAFINGKMNLLEAEGLADLIAAETDAQKQQAIQQMKGGASRFYDGLREAMIRCLAWLEAYIDFPDEEIPESVVAQLTLDIEKTQSLITAALQDQKRGERLREGIRVVILGAPNAGKSSLLNALAGREAAIVSHRAGTTRDIIEVHMDMAGYPVILMDTAGIRETDCELEGEGVRRALEQARSADIRLIVLDGSEAAPDPKNLELIDEHSLIAINKSDILILNANNLPFKKNIFYLSVKTGEGMEELMAAMEHKIVSYFSAGGAPFITRQRHRHRLEEASGFLEKSLRALPLELKCEELRLASQAVAKITGQIQVDDVLDVIFKQFCIGK